MLLSRTTNPYTVRSVKESKFTIDKDGVAITVGLDPVTKMP